jgi:hypothetical protein
MSFVFSLVIFREQIIDRWRMNNQAYGIIVTNDRGAKGITFGNALVANMKKPCNHFLVKKVVMDQATAINVIYWNMLQI